MSCPASRRGIARRRGSEGPFAGFGHWELSARPEGRPQPRIRRGASFQKERPRLSRDGTAWTENSATWLSNPFRNFITMSVLRQGAGQTWLYHSNFVNSGASELQLRRAFRTDPAKALQRFLDATGRPGVSQAGPAPARASFGAA